MTHVLPLDGAVDFEVERMRKRIAALEVSQRRAIALIETLLPYTMWDGACDAQEQSHAEATLELLRKTLLKA